MLSFQRLEVYQRAIEFYALALEIIAELPRGQAEVGNQLGRAALSQPLNIAEGAGRRSPADAARHYAIARGSAMESAAILDALNVQKAITAERYERGIGLLTSIVAMLTKMIAPTESSSTVGATSPSPSTTTSKSKSTTRL